MLVGGNLLFELLMAAIVIPFYNSVFVAPFVKH